MIDQAGNKLEANKGYTLTFYYHSDTEIKQTIEDKLFEEAKSNPEYAQNAWNVTVRDLENLFQAVVESAGAGSHCTVSVLPDETL